MINQALTKADSLSCGTKTCWMTVLSTRTTVTPHVHTGSCPKTVSLSARRFFSPRNNHFLNLTISISSFFGESFIARN